MRLKCLVLFLLTLLTPAQAQVEETLQLNPGWNAVAFRCGTLTAVNASSGVAGLAVYSGGSYRTGSISVTEINSGDGTSRGFFVFCTGAAQLTYTGTDLPGRGPTLRQGWNLLAFPLRNGSISSRSLTLRRNGLAVSLTQLLLPQFYELGANNSLNSVDVSGEANLSTSRAYWVFCSADGVTLSFGSTDPLDFSPTIGLAACNATIRGLTTSLSDNTENLDTTRLQSLAQGTVLLAASLGNGGSRTVTSTLGGSAVINVSSGTATVTFSGYRTPNATLNGTISTALTGTVASGTFTADASYTNFTVAVSGGATYAFDGTAGLNRVRTGTGTVAVNSTFTANFTAADTSGPYIRYENVVVTTSTTLTGASFSGTQSYAGGVAFQNYNGATGRAVITTPAPLSFLGTLTSFQVTAGQLLFTGNGALRLTVTSPNTVEVAVRLPGTQPFIVVGSFSWGALGGPTSAT